MPITSSAKKALRASKHKRVFNIRHQNSIADAVKKIEKLVVAKSAKEALKLLPLAYKEIDKAAKVGLIKKNNAARKKSQLAALIKKIK